MIDFGRELDSSEGIHCMENSPYTDDAELTYPIEGEYLITKRRYSAFFGTDLEILLKGLHVDTLYLIGGLTDVCIHYTAVDAHQRDYHIRVVTDAVAGSSEDAHRYALKAIQYLQRDALITAADIENEGRSTCETTPLKKRILSAPLYSPIAGQGAGDMAAAC